MAGVSSSSDVRRTPASAAEATLARALGLAQTGEAVEAVDGLTAVLSEPALSTPWRILALKSRATVQEDLGVWDFPVGPERDRRLIAALADNRAWAALAPGDPNAASGVALNLQELGAYSEAIAAFHAIELKWPNEDYSVAVRVGAVYRSWGQYDRALASLDDLVTRKGPQAGMKFHYHRGLTLLKLGRAEEAVKAFDAGLKDQPGYMWAMAYRACASATAGRVASAFADQEKAIPIFVAWGHGQRPSQARDHDLRRLKEVSEQLRAPAAGRTAKLVGLCDGYWDAGDKTRQRSPLLPAP